MTVMSLRLEEEGAANQFPWKKLNKKRESFACALLCLLKVHNDYIGAYEQHVFSFSSFKTSHQIKIASTNTVWLMNVLIVLFVSLSLSQL